MSETQRCQAGDLVLDAAGNLLVRASDEHTAQGWPWAYPGSWAPSAHPPEGALPDSYAVRPLTLLVRDGHPVPAARPPAPEQGEQGQDAGLAARLAGIRAYVEAATPDPWWFDEDGACWRLHGVGWWTSPQKGVPAQPVGKQILKAAKLGTPYAEYWPEPADAAMIVKGRTDLPALLAGVEAVVELCDAADDRAAKALFDDAYERGQTGALRMMTSGVRSALAAALAPKQPTPPGPGAAAMPDADANAVTEDGDAPAYAFPGEAECEQANDAAAFYAKDGPGTETLPCLAVAGVLVFAYLDAETGAVRVSVHLDTTDPTVVRPDGTVPLRIEVGDTVVFDDSGRAATPPGSQP